MASQHDSQQLRHDPSDLHHDNDEAHPEPQQRTTADKKKHQKERPSKMIGRTRERRQRAGKQHKTTTERSNNNDAPTTPASMMLVEDEASAWQTCLETQQVWGGRGRGGRGAYAGRTNSVHGTIHLTAVSVQVASSGLELLRDATMDIIRGHRYGLCGRNGVGKSTLLRRLAARAIPGLPHDMRVLLVEQQQQQDIPNTNSSTQQQQQPSALEVLVRSDTYRTSLLKEQEEIETMLEDPSSAVSEESVVAGAERLGLIAAELDAVEADTAQERALAILQGLQFTNAMVHGPAANLSGGWRMRLALARALYIPNTDLICLDECDNYLDLYGLEWLIQYLNSCSDRKTLMVVSHDRAFLNAICTDIVVLEHQRLSYHVGNYSMYEQQMREKAARETQILDAAGRQRTKAQAFVQKQQANKKSADPNKQRQAKMIREKKMDRIGNYREDGKRYKQRSLKTLDEKSVRLAQKVQIETDEQPVVKMLFPNPTWPPAVGPNDAIVRMENLSFGYNGDDSDNDTWILENVTLTIDRGSKIAVVGRNGSGKSTLVKVLSDEQHEQTGIQVKGSLWKQPSIRIAYLSQYAVDEMEAYAKQTVLEYAEEHLRKGRASASVVAKASGSGNVRQYLGAFGLGGPHALRPIGKLSGGERMRLCFATVLADEPHLLLLDESTAHLDIETLDSLSSALNEFEGSVLMVSHNQAFLSGFCQELWVLEEDGQVTVDHSDTESFDTIFSAYRSSILQATQKGALLDHRRQKADLAKRATQQRAGAQQNTALL